MGRMMRCLGLFCLGDEGLSAGGKCTMPEFEVARLCAWRADSVSSVGLPDAGGDGGLGWDMVVCGT